jgi:hypothetical protein
MLPFANKLKTARNKFTAHNDVQTILQQPPLAVFDKSEDSAYFVTLEQFMSIAQGGLFLVGSLIPNDVALSMTAFDRGRIR